MFNIACIYYHSGCTTAADDTNILRFHYNHYHMEIDQSQNIRRKDFASDRFPYDMVLNYKTYNL